MGRQGLLEGRSEPLQSHSPTGHRLRGPHTHCNGRSQPQNLGQAAEPMWEYARLQSCFSTRVDLLLISLAGTKKKRESVIVNPLLVPPGGEPAFGHRIRDVQLGSLGIEIEFDVGWMFASRMWEGHAMWVADALQRTKRRGALAATTSPAAPSVAQHTSCLLTVRSRAHGRSDP